MNLLPGLLGPGEAPFPAKIRLANLGVIENSRAGFCLEKPGGPPKRGFQGEPLVGPGDYPFPRGTPGRHPEKGDHLQPAKGVGKSGVLSNPGCGKRPLSKPRGPIQAGGKHKPRVFLKKSGGKPPFFPQETDRWCPPRGGGNPRREYQRGGRMPGFKVANRGCCNPGKKRGGAKRHAPASHTEGKWRLPHEVFCGHPPTFVMRTN